MPQYVVVVPNEHEDEDNFEADTRYSTAIEAWVLLLGVPIIFAAEPPMVPTVSVTPELPSRMPTAAKTKSLVLVVDTPATEGAEAPETHAVEVWGKVAGSNGDAVFAPDIPNTWPDAADGVPLKWTVTASLLNFPDAIPYHSILVVSWLRPAQDVVDDLADPCHVTALAESVTDETVMLALAIWVVTHKTITSFVIVVVTAASGNEEPLAHVPEALPSRDGSGVAKRLRPRDPAGIDVADENCGDQRYMLAPTARVKEPAEPGWVVCVSTVRQGAVHPVTGAFAFS
jgi:hypothetical protein